MEVKSLENLRDAAVIKRAKTRLHFNEFTYTWTLERYIKFKSHTENVFIASPTIVVYNDDDKYEFQLQINTIKNIRSSTGSYYNKMFSMDLKVLSCPDVQTTVHVSRSILCSNGTEYYLLESVAAITKNAVICNYGVSVPEAFSQCDSDGNLTVKCKFTFYNKHSHVELETPELEAAAAQSKTSILDEYEKLFNSGKFSDVTLVVGDKKFSAHKNILASRSPVFSAMFEHQMLENKESTVKITDVEPEIMAEVLRFIYSSKVKNLKESTADLLAAADKYQLEALRLMCEEVFVEKLNLDSLEEILKIVDKYEMCRRLRDATLKFVSYNGKEVANWENFDRVLKTLSPSLLFEVTKATLLKA